MKRKNLWQGVYFNIFVRPYFYCPYPAVPLSFLRNCVTQATKYMRDKLPVPYRVVCKVTVTVNYVRSVLSYLSISFVSQFVFPNVFKGFNVRVPFISLHVINFLVQAQLLSKCFHISAPVKPCFKTPVSLRCPLYE